MKYSLVTSLLFVAICGFALPCDAQEYLSYDTLVQLQKLSPELSNSRLISLSAKGHGLWKSGQLKVKASSATTVRGDFTEQGAKEVAYLLENNKKERFLVVAEEKGDQLNLLLLYPLKKEKIGCLLWDRKKRTICIDTGKRRRKTGPARLTSTPGKGTTSTPGFVIEEWFVNAWYWNEKQKKFLKRYPYWFNPDK